MIPTPRPDKDRYSVLCLALSLCRAMAERPQTMYQLADQAGCCPRTVRRVITALRRVGIDILARRWEDDRAIRYSVDRAAWVGLLDLPSD